MGHESDDTPSTSRLRQGVPSGDPSREDLRAGYVKENDAACIRIEERERRPARILEDQDWRCAYACAGNGEGRPMLPGEAFAYIDDHEGIVHVDCLKAGTVPSEGNPWTINGARRKQR